MGQGRRPRDRRAEILEIAGPLFLENGYQGTSMSQIAAAVGGSKGTLYSYFKNKEELFAAYLEQGVRTRGLVVFTFPEHTDNLAEVLTILGRRYLELITEAPAVAMLRILYHESPHFPEIGRIFYETCILRTRQQLADYLFRANARGVLDIRDPSFAAEQFLTLCQADLLIPVMLCVKPEIRPEEVGKVVAAAVSMFLAAYAPRPCTGTREAGTGS